MKALKDSLINGFFLAFVIEVARLCVPIEIRHPLNALPKENWIPNTLLFLFILCYFFWGLFYLRTFFMTPEGRDLSWPGNWLRRATSTVETYISFAIGYLLAFIIFHDHQQILSKTSNPLVAVFYLVLVLIMIELLMYVGSCFAGKQWVEKIGLLGVGLFLTSAAFMMYLELLVIPR